MYTCTSPVQHVTGCQLGGQHTFCYKVVNRRRMLPMSVRLVYDMRNGNIAVRAVGMSSVFLW